MKNTTKKDTTKKRQKQKAKKQTYNIKKNIKNAKQ